MGSWRNGVSLTIPTTRKKTLKLTFNFRACEIPELETPQGFRFKSGVPHFFLPFSITKFREDHRHFFISVFSRGTYLHRGMTLMRVLM